MPIFHKDGPYVYACAKWWDLGFRMYAYAKWWGDALGSVCDRLISQGVPPQQSFSVSGHKKKPLFLEWAGGLPLAQAS